MCFRLSAALLTLCKQLASLKLNLKTFEVMGNRFVYPPPDVVLRGRDAILDHLFRFPVVAGNSLAADLSVYLTIPRTLLLVSYASRETRIDGSYNYCNWSS